VDENLYHLAEVALKGRVTDGAFAHCQRVAATAADLAAAYGEDVELARLAGLLHDWDRDQTHSDLVESAAHHGVAVTEIDERWPYLLHAKTAAAELASALPGLPPEVLSAIANHTVGSPEMTNLDKVVLIADSLEPARHKGNVGELRAAVGVVDLDELFARVYQATLAQIVEHRRWIHSDTIAVWNALVARERG